MKIDLAPLVGLKCKLNAPELVDPWVDFVSDEKLIVPLDSRFLKRDSKGKSMVCDALKIKRLLSFQPRDKEDNEEFNRLLKNAVYDKVSPDACTRLQLRPLPIARVGNLHLEVRSNLVIDLSIQCVVGFYDAEEEKIKELTRENVQLCRALHLEYLPPAFANE